MGADDANLLAYQTRQDAIKHILVERLDDFLEFTRVLLRDDDAPNGGTREQSALKSG